MLLLTMLSMGGVIWRLNRYKQSLQNTVTTLRAWAVAPAQALPPDSNDPVATAVIELVREGVERELEAARAALAQQASADLVSQAARTAHDIRGPVAALAVVLPVLQDIDPEVRDLASGALDRITAIADDLLTRKRNDAPTQPRSIALASLVRQVVGEVQARRPPGCRVSVDLRLHADAPCTAMVAPHAFQRTVANLLNNAVEAVEPAGQVTVTLGGANKRVFVHIHDSGVGMDAERLRALGNEGATFGKTAGNGLGVHQAYAFAHEHGGSLVYCSAVGQGTAVRLWLAAA